MIKTAEDLVRAAKEQIQELSAREVADRLAAGADFVLIDVRESAEFASGHIPGAVNIPRGVLEFEVAAHPAMANEITAPELARHERPICVYCRSGGRSAVAAQSLQEMGFTSVTSLAGGLLDWRAHEFPVE